MKKVLLSFAGSLLSFFSLAQDCGNELFFSEYLEGSSYNKALELYNPSQDTKELSDYEIQILSNGNLTPSASFSPIGTIPPRETFLIVHKSAGEELLALADTSFSGTSIVNFNGNDALILIKKSSGDTLDIIGTIGEDAIWTAGSGSTADYTLVRNPDVVSGNKDWTSASAEWDALGKDDFTSAGVHSLNFTCTVTAVEAQGKESEFYVYPNPSFGSVIQFNKPTRYTLYDLTGKVITEGEGKELNLKPDKGTYILRTDEGHTELLHFY